MFTGIIEEVGRIAKVVERGENRRVTIEAKLVTGDLHTGDSISVSGCCLTALDITPTSFCADLAPETWTRTSFSRLHAGALVNLERSMPADGRFGGHIVQGHVDGVGTLTKFAQLADSGNWWLEIEVPAEIERYLVFKGSITIEGISLTIARLEGRACSVAIIPHTYEATNLRTLKAGDPVNLEADVIGKYVERLMGERMSKELGMVEMVKAGF